MPYFGSLIDDLRIHRAKTKEDKAYWEGYRAGKAWVLKRVAIGGFILVIFILVSRYLILHGYLGIH